MDKPITKEKTKKILELTKSISDNSEYALLRAIDYRRNEDHKSDTDESLSNLFEFILLLNFELSCFMRNMLNSESKLGPNLYGRHILLIIHESTLTLRSLIANQFKNDSESNLNQIDIDRFKKIHSNICKLHDKTAKKFGEIRNGITAHKDENAEERIKLIEESDIKEITDLALEFFPLIVDLQKSLDTYVKNFKA
jgi:hypothetical protein